MKEYLCLPVFLMCSLVGFIDDYISLKKKRSLGLRGWVKIFLLIVICIYFIVIGIWVLKTGYYYQPSLDSLGLGYGLLVLPAVVVIIISCNQMR